MLANLEYNNAIINILELLSDFTSAPPPPIFQMIALYKDPNGEKIFTQTPVHNKSQPPVEEKSIVHALEVKIKGLETQIEELTVNMKINITTE